MLMEVLLSMSCRVDESWMWMARACRSETSAACGRHGSSQDAVSECSTPLSVSIHNPSDPAARLHLHQRP